MISGVEEELQSNPEPTSSGFVRRIFKPLYAVRFPDRVFMILCCHDPVACVICASLRQVLQMAFEIWNSRAKPPKAVNAE